MAAATATILLPGGQVTVTGEADSDALWLTPAELAKAGAGNSSLKDWKFYGTTFQEEVAALGGRPYYTPLDLGG